MRKTVLLLLFCFACFSSFAQSERQSQSIKLKDGSEILVVDVISIDHNLILKKVVHSEIIADVKSCGESPGDGYLYLKSTNIENNLYKKIIKSYSAYLIKQNNTQLYVHSLSDILNISCEPQKNISLKILILQLYDRKKRTDYNLILLQ